MVKKAEVHTFLHLEQEGNDRLLEAIPFQLNDRVMLTGLYGVETIRQD